VVVNDITLEDQLFIQNLQQAVHKLRHAGRHGIKYEDVIVIHNYVKIISLAEMNDTYTDQVIERNKKGNKWNKQTLNQKVVSYFYTEATDSACGIRHINILKDSTDIDVQAHNTGMFNLLTSWLQAISYSRAYSPFEDFLRYGNEVLMQYLDNTLNLRVFKWDNEGVPVLSIGWYDPTEYHKKQNEIKNKNDNKSESENDNDENKK